MSTFTDWNGPQGSNVRANDLIKFANAYQELLNKFNEYQKTIENDPEPRSGSNNYLTSGTIYQALSNLRSSLNDYLTKATAEADYEKKLIREDSPRAGSSNFVTSDGIYNAIKNFATESFVNNALTDYLKTNNLSETDIIQDMQGQLTAIQEQLEQPNLNKEQLTADSITGLINVVNELNFQDKHVSAYIGGSHGPGVFYVLGMLEPNKAGTAYIKYNDGQPFSAVVNFTSTDNEKGSLSVLTDATIPDLKFLLVKGTPNDGSGENVYLAIQSTQWIPRFASTDGKGMFNSIDFDVSGINFIPMDTTKYVQYNADCLVLSECPANYGFNASGVTVENLNLDTLRDSTNNIMIQMQHVIDELGIDHRKLLIGDKNIDDIQLWKRPAIVSEDPDNPDAEAGIVVDHLATVNDIQNLAGIPIGAKIGWPVYEEVIEHGEVVMLRAKDFPDSFVALDGSTINTADHPELARDVYHTTDATIQLPVEDCMIMKVKMDIPDTTPPERVTVLNYNQLITLLKNTSASLKAEIERSEGEDATHNEALGALNTAIDNLTNDLGTETQARTDADTALGGRIDAEASTREAADTALSDRIDNEASTREAADTELSNRIDNETQARTDADTVLGGRIDTEASTREAADTELSNRIDITNSSLANEVTERTENDSLLSEAISNEAQARTDADTALGNRIDAEDTRIGEEEAMRDLQDRMIHEVIDGKHAPGSIGWSRWKLPYEVDELPATTDDYEVGDRIHVASTDQKYFVDSNRQWSQTGITNPTGSWF